ncbi:MAG TPA: hypothetical protein VIN67_06595, partial [Desulfobaccales bacterium]
MQSDLESSSDLRRELPAHSPFFPSRILAMLWRHSRTMRTLLREDLHRKWNIFWTRRLRNGLSGSPVSLGLDLTRRCNLKCRMCEQYRHVAAQPAGLSWYDPNRELPLSAWTDLLDQVASFRPRPRLYISGGEP